MEHVSIVLGVAQLGVIVWAAQRLVLKVDKLCVRLGSHSERIVRLETKAGIN
jgi:hypothetical protein